MCVNYLYCVSTKLIQQDVELTNQTKSIHPSFPPSYSKSKPVDDEDDVVVVVVLVGGIVFLDIVDGDGIPIMDRGGGMNDRLVGDDIVLVPEN